VFSKLKWEAGVHRVQRVPATEAAGRVHTSTATVAIMPEVGGTGAGIHLCGRACIVRGLFWGLPYSPIGCCGVHFSVQPSASRHPPPANPRTIDPPSPQVDDVDVTLDMRDVEIKFARWVAAGEAVHRFPSSWRPTIACRGQPRKPG
jgi:hypothetical protein